MYSGDLLPFRTRAFEQRGVHVNAEYVHIHLQWHLTCKVTRDTTAVPPISWLYLCSTLRSIFLAYASWGCFKTQRFRRMHLHCKVYPEGAVSYNFGSILKSLHFTLKHDGNKTLGFFSFITNHACYVTIENSI